MFRSLVGSTLFLVALSVAPRMARAEDATREPVRPAALVEERQKLRIELERVNTEIDALKHEKRGFRDDYRLRARMADAEALARRLIDLDARLGSTERGSSAPGDGATWPSAPVASPSDDRADLEAKADILSDQSRRLNGQADVLAVRVADLRKRQELRRRAGQLERDPFSPLEQAKRRIATTVPLAAGGDANAGHSRVVDQATTPPTFTGAPQGPTTVGTSSPGASLVPPGADSVSKGPTSTASTPAPTASPIPATPDTAGSVAAQFRGILDASTLAEIRRLEAPGSSSGSLPAMERALSALRSRATQLEVNASTLRNRAKVARHSTSP
jgi:hypothetical protein